MKLRSKLLALLLAVAVGPLIFTVFYGFAKLRDMGGSLGDQVADALLERLQQELQLVIEYNARIMQQKGELVEARLDALAEAAERALDRDDPVGAPTYWASDFDAGRVPADQLSASRRHFKPVGGAMVPMRIATRAQVIKLAPDVAPDQVAGSVLRLSSLTPAYRSAYDRHPGLFFWVYVSLENGVHSSFPGHGGYPETYDGRRRPWYENALAAGETVWSEALVDATTGQALVTASRPIHYADGGIAGVVGIDVPIQALLNEVRVRAKISQGATVLIVRASRRQGRGALEILAALEDETRDWRRTRDTRVLTAADDTFVAMVDEIIADRSGVVRLPYRGADSVWAYGIFEQTSDALVVVLPFADVAKRARAARDFVQAEALGIASVIGAFVVLVLGITAAVAWGGARTITRPLGELAGAARDLAGGNFDVRVPVRSTDEVGQLSGVFNEVAPQLLDRIRARESLAHLGRYFSPNLAEQLTRNPELLNLGGERREMTFVFTDLEGFTALVEASPPEDIVPVLNEYLDGMSRIVWEHDGTVDKIVGDAVHAMFGAPLDQPDHAVKGVRCALEMDRFAESFRAGLVERGRLELGRTRIGVNTGRVTVGNFGGEVMFDYTAHGDAINTAARLEGANKHLGTRILVSGNTVREIDGFAGRPVGRLVLSGRSAGLMAFEPLSAEESGSRRVRAYVSAYEVMRQGGTQALAAFRRLRADYPDDDLVRFHLDRLESGDSGETVILRGK